jgi:hypothetical protein
MNPVELARKTVSEMKIYEKEVSYLGRTMDILPSGRCYQPWTCNNISVEEMIEDIKWWKDFSNELRKNNAWTETDNDYPFEVWIVRAIYPHNC